MKALIMLLLALGLSVSPAEAHRSRYYNYPNSGYVYTPNGYVYAPNGYVDAYGVYYPSYNDDGYRYYRKVRSHKRRRNVLLGVGALGLLTGSRAATAIGLGGVVANELIDRRHRDW